MDIVTRQSIIDWFKELQDNICNSLEELDGQGAFREDPWRDQRAVEAAPESFRVGILRKVE